MRVWEAEERDEKDRECFSACRCKEKAVPWEKPHYRTAGFFNGDTRALSSIICSIFTQDVLSFSKKRIKHALAGSDICVG